MADIYVVYGHPDRDAACRLVDGLASRWSVWWDEDLVGRFPEEIEKELRSARCVVPLFSEDSRTRDMVLDELRLAKALEISIIPARLDSSRPPYGFGSYSHVDLAGWTGEAEHLGWRQLQHKISRIVSPRERPRRPSGLLADRLLLPAVFTSVSSHETQLTPEDALALLTAYRSQTVLISAYDWAPERVTDARIAAVKALKASGALVLVDSGNYEASRLQDRTWSPERFAQALACIPHDLACSFDVMEPALDPWQARDEVLEAVARDASFTSAPIVPIVHAARLERGGHLLETLPQLMTDLATALQPAMLAIPERELGPGLIARAQTLRSIRTALDALPFY